MCCIRIALLRRCKDCMSSICSGKREIHKGCHAHRTGLDGGRFVGRLSGNSKYGVHLLSSQDCSYDTQHHDMILHLLQS